MRWPGRRHVAGAASGFPIPMRGNEGPGRTSAARSPAVAARTFPIPMRGNENGRVAACRHVGARHAVSDPHEG